MDEISRLDDIHSWSKWLFTQHLGPIQEVKYINYQSKTDDAFVLIIESFEDSTDFSKYDLEINDVAFQHFWSFPYKGIIDPYKVVSISMSSQLYEYLKSNDFPKSGNPFIKYIHEVLETQYLGLLNDFNIKDCISITWQDI